MKYSPNAPCPCGSGRKFKKCCAIVHRGRPVPPTRLMPARYSAYAVGNVQFIMRTTHPGGPHWRDDNQVWARELADYCNATTFAALTILEHDIGETQGWVTFRADLRQANTPVGFVERSLFLLHEGRWLYNSGEML